MNPNQDGYLNGHYSNLNRSPSSTRPGYASTSGFPGALGSMNTGRAGPRGAAMDQLSQQVGDMNLYGEDRFNTFNGSRYDRTGPSAPMPGNFMFGNSQAWNYNNSNVATINDPSRMRGSLNRRAPLPSEWGAMGDAGMGGGQVPGMARGQLQHHYPPSSITTNGMYTTLGPSATGFAPMPDLRPQVDPDEEGQGVIKTAIVIKNIPFNVRKETLQGLMVDMNLPQPYAFNYHFDNGVFRGLAFANFAHWDETQLVIQQMNGMDVAGRKLRVEYKKMLPEHERERIEREKREKRGQLEEQHRTMPQLQHQPSSSTLQTMSISETAASSFRQVGLDLNNPDTLKFYIELFMFKKDTAREILIFPNTITPEERRDIHILAHTMGFAHSSVGEGVNRQLVVRKDNKLEEKDNVLSLPAGATLDAHPRGLSRAATIDFAERSRVTPSSAFHAQHRTGGLLGVPVSPDGPHAMNGLRGVKSFADLRSYSPSPSPSVTSASNIGVTSNAGVFGHYTTDSGFPSMPIGPPSSAGADGSTLTPQTSSGGLSSLTRAAFDSAGSNSQIARPRDGPGPGAIGSQRPGANGTGTIGRVPDRQPRGPPTENSGFGRTRQNGHMQRGSDSSDTTTARTGTSGSTWNH